MSEPTVFICKRSHIKPDNIVPIRLELPRETLEKYKEKAQGTKYTAKEIMENMLTNWVEGVASNV